jgi:hypothetical protein
VIEKVKVEANKSRSRTEQLLWQATHFYLQPYARFESSGHSFVLETNPFGDEHIHSGPYRMGRNVEDANAYRIGHPRVIVPLATVLRSTLLEVSTARLINDGQQTKAEMVYQYLTGPRFRQRVEAIVEAFSSMQDDLDKERKAIMKQWAKRSEQIERVMSATVGMYGDLQGIAGKSIQEIEGLELPALGVPADDNLF